MNKLVFLTLSLLAIIGVFGNLVLAQKSYNELCDEEKNETIVKDNVTSTVITSDNCDKKVFLICKESRCRCSDAVFGIYTSKELKVVITTRSKRSPGKGKGGSKGKVSTGKAVAVGAGAAVVAGGAGYLAGQHSGSNSGSGSWSSSSGSSRSKERYVTVHSCYQRVGGDCAIDTNKVTEITNTTIVNGVTTTFKNTITYKDRPECIQGAECVAKRSPGPDTNIGECACISGFGKTKTDTCVKVKKNSAGMAASSLGLLLAALMIQFV